MTDIDTVKEKSNTPEKKGTDLKKKCDSEESAFDKELKLSQLSHNLVILFLSAFSILFVVTVVVAGLQTYSFYSFQKKTRESFEEVVEREKAKIVRMYKMLPYQAKIDWAIRQLKYGTPAERDVAVWNDLLGLLKDKKNTPDFPDIVLEFKKVIPLLELDVKEEDFRDSYRGEIWICIFLLESDVDEVVTATKEILPPIEVISKVLNDNILKVPEGNRTEFETSIKRLEYDLTR